MSVNIPPGFGQAAFVLTGSVGTPDFITTIGVDLTEVGGDYVAAANGCFHAYATAFMGTTSDSLTLEQCLLTVGQDGFGNGSVSSSLAPVSGGDSGDQVPINLAVILQKHTADLGRRGRGRMFLPGLANQSQVLEDGHLTTAAQTGFTAAAADFLLYLRTDADTGGYPAMEPVLLHSTGAPTPLLAPTISPIIGVIRKRVR